MKELLESSFFIVLNLFLIKPLDKHIYFFILLIKISTILTCYVLKNKKMLTKLIIVIYFEYQNILKQNNKKEKVKQW